MCVFITAVPITKLFAWGEGDSGGHVLRFDVVTGVEALSRCVHELAASDILVFVARLLLSQAWAELRVVACFSSNMLLLSQATTSAWASVPCIISYHVGSLGKESDVRTVHSSASGNTEAREGARVGFEHTFEHNALIRAQCLNTTTD